MGKKYVLTDNKREYDDDGNVLYQIRRCSDGALGAWVEDESSLSQDGTCWADERCQLLDGTEVSGDVQLSEVSVYNTRIECSGVIIGGMIEESVITGNVIIYAAQIEEADIKGDIVLDNTPVDNSDVLGNVKAVSSWICDESIVEGDVVVLNSMIQDKSHISGDTVVMNVDHVRGAERSTGILAGTRSSYGHDKRWD